MEEKLYDDDFENLSPSPVEAKKPAVFASQSWLEAPLDFNIEQTMKELKEEKDIFSELENDSFLKSYVEKAKTKETGTSHVSSFVPNVDTDPEER